MRAGDLAGYRAKKRDPLCRNYRRWRVCTMPPPTSGGVTTLQVLGLLERFELAQNELYASIAGPNPTPPQWILVHASRIGNESFLAKIMEELGRRNQDPTFGAFFERYKALRTNR